MNAMPEPGSPAATIRVMAGWGVKYVACSLLAILLPLCLAAVAFVLIVLMQPGAPLHFLRGMRPPAALGKPGAASVDIGPYIGRAFLVVSVALTLVSWLWRGLRRRGQMAVQDAARPLAQHLRLHGRRRLLAALGVVSAVYASAFAALPFARMAAGSSRGGMLGVLIALYAMALAFAAIYVVLASLADWILDG